MSYERHKGHGTGIVARRARRGGRVAMGDLSSIVSGISAAVDVAGDPYLPEIICRVQQLHSIRSHQPIQVCQDTPLGIPGGVGLGRLVLPLRAFVFAEANPWVYPVGIAVLIGLPVLIGYELGKGSK